MKTDDNIVGEFAARKTLTKAGRRAKGTTVIRKAISGIIDQRVVDNLVNKSDPVVVGFGVARSRLINYPKA